ncbi:MAG: hypothetical protein K6G44_01220 [Lentisphaeria bacterium]|nr:hypothetical protein [Lentisphaeria bacterium]
MIIIGKGQDWAKGKAIAGNRTGKEENAFHHIVAVDDGPDDRQAFKVKWRRVERPKAFAVFSEKRACLPMGEVAFPINLTCQNRQDLNNWLVKDLCPRHEGESMDGAEKISTFVHCAIQNGLR